MLLGKMMLGAVAQDGKFTVKGTFEHLGDSVVFFLSHDLDQGDIRTVTGKMIEVTFDLEDANFITIGRWHTGRPLNEDGDIALPAIPGETLVVSKDANGGLSLSGSQFYVDYDEAWKRVDTVNKEGDALMKELTSKMQAGADEEPLPFEE